jgi:tRNA(fMet)-specific endonuclease VapC
MIVLDSDVFTIWLYDNSPRLRQRIDALPETETVAITIVTLHESLVPLLEAVKKAANWQEQERATKKLQRTWEFLRELMVIYPTEQSYQQFDTLMSAKQKNQRKKDRSDMMIASMVLTASAVLVTRNTKDYQGIANLRIENWID